MKKGFLALCALTALSAYGQGQQSNPEDMNLSFDTDAILFMTEPKYTLSLGARSLSGVKTNFGGTGQVASELRNGDATGHRVTRFYHDGAVGVDKRTVTEDDGNGGTINVPITPDGLTDNWRYSDSRQANPDGTIAMHTYTADILNGGPRTKNPSSSYGVELNVKRDGGKIGTRLNWSLIGGLSLNGMSSRLSAAEQATVTTVTDTYSLNGASAPPAPYTSRISTNENAFDANGNPILDANGGNVTRLIDNTVLIADEPQTRATSVATTLTNVTNRYRLKGAFFTFRAGPTLILPITQKLRATLSLGAAVVFAGSEYEVLQEFQPDTADVITDTVTDREAKLLPGYFADANMEYTLTDRAGIYAGAIYQGTGSYTQKIETASANYQSKIDLSALSGFHFGMNVRF